MELELYKCFSSIFVVICSLMGERNDSKARENTVDTKNLMYSYLSCDTKTITSDRMTEDEASTKKAHSSCRLMKNNSATTPATVTKTKLTFQTCLLK